MFNYFRYMLVVILIGGFGFYSTTATIDGGFLSETINSKLPKEIEKKKFLITVNEFKINDIANKVVDGTVIGTVKPTNGSLMGSFFKKKIPFKIGVSGVPKVQGTKISLSVREVNINNTLKVKEVKGILRKLIESIKVENKHLKSASKYLYVKGVEFQDNGDLLIKYKVRWSILLAILPFLLLREIGLMLIAFYQAFLSPRKGYKCAKGVLHENGTCSSCVKDAFEQGGFIPGMKEYFKSTKECKEAYAEIKRREDYQKKKGDKCNECAGCDGTPLLVGDTIAGCGKGKASAAGGSAGGCGEIGACEAGACGAGAGGCDVGSC